MDTVPHGSPEGAEDRERGDVLGFVERPVVGREGPGQRHLSEGDDEVEHPEPHEELVDLQVDGVPAQEQNSKIRTMILLTQTYWLMGDSFLLCSLRDSGFLQEVRIDEVCLLLTRCLHT